MKKKKLEFNLPDLINKYSNKIPLNELFNIKLTQRETNSWFDIKDKNIDGKFISCNPSHIEHADKVTKCHKITILPTPNQKNILLKWFEAYRLMYNKTISLIRKLKFNGNDSSFDFKRLRTHFLMDDKKIIINKYNIQSHILDGAIKLACTSHKSAISNLKNKNIKHFKIKYIKKDKPSKILDLEKNMFFDEGFCKRSLGVMNKNDKDLFFNDIKHDSKLHYNTKTGIFTLLVPVDKNSMNPKSNNRYVGIDPGIRTFMTGISNKKVFVLGNNLTETIKKDLKRTDKINGNKNISNKIKKRYETLLNKRIKNRINDLHWKSIKYLTDNFDNIIIGNWSTKDIIKNNESVLQSITKRLATSVRYYVFLERLKYKCQSENISLQVVNESFTSKTCTNCGEIKSNLGSNKIFNCEKCKIKMGRDMNGARNICMKGFK